jgi:acetyl-CoA/propionyl-CoA carboxylase biotin carboxyl carrier protein
MFEKVLVANRGEIAIRIMRTLKELGVVSVGVYSEADRDAPHVREADEAFLLGPPLPAESYLAIAKIVETAERAGAGAIHPGYGFLAENAEFAAACEAAGIEFVGPPAAAIEAMGSKTRAREIMNEAGVPIVPGMTAPVESVAHASREAEAIGYPVACKAAGGGGGKGFRVAASAEEIEAAFEGAAREGERFFGDPTVYIERYLEDPRHVEVQVLADAHGNVIHLGERDCSIQRRHQKLIEEAPAPHVDAEMRERIGKIATTAAAAVGYRSAGTVEGLQVGDEYFFLEMNTRVQVEHCVTEMITGIDIVREQMLIASGEALSVSQEEVELRGHSIECRINAEAAHAGFTPAPGTIGSYREPAGPGVRVDSGVVAGSEVTPIYDPMIAKLIVWDRDRDRATARMLRALGEYEIGGLTTLLPFHQAILRSGQWARGETCRDLLGDTEWLSGLEPEPGAAGRALSGGGADAQPSAGVEAVERSAAAPGREAQGAAGGGLVEREYKVEVDGRLFGVKVIGEAGPAAGGSAGSALRRPPRRGRSEVAAGAGGATETLVSPIQGTVLSVAVQEGSEVEEGALICVIEAMKMENEITAHRAGEVSALNVSEGGSIASGEVIAVIE